MLAEIGLYHVSSPFFSSFSWYSAVVLVFTSIALNCLPSLLIFPPTICLTFGLIYGYSSLCNVCALDMRATVQKIFKLTPHEKQVMMFSATLDKEIRQVCKKFMQDVSLSFPSSAPLLFYSPSFPLALIYC